MPPRPHTTAPITLLSWNVLSTRAYNKYNKPKPTAFHRARWGSILATVNTHRPSVLLLQEVDRDFLDWFVPRLRGGYGRWESVHLSTIQTDYRNDDFGTCVLYDAQKHIPIRTGMLFDPDNYGKKDSTYLVCEVSKAVSHTPNKSNTRTTTYFICSVHLPGRNDDAAKRLLNDIEHVSKGCTYKIIGGDFNRDMSCATMWGKSVKQLACTKNTRRRATPTTCDFDYTTRPKPASAEIDKCLLSRNLEFTPKSHPRELPYSIPRKVTCKAYTIKHKSRFVRVVGSDHFPLVTHIRPRTKA